MQSLPQNWHCRATATRSSISWRLLVLVVVLGCVSLASATETDAKPSGLWQGTMPTAAGDVNFEIELGWDHGRLHASLLNATDRQPFSSATWDGKTLTLRLDYYDGTLAAHFTSANHMEGEYSRLGGRGLVHIPVSLVPQPNATPSQAWTGPTISGDWVFHRPGEDGMDKVTVANFHQQDQATAEGKVPVDGILEPVSGDTGLLHGFVSQAPNATHFHLSRFDGIHVLAIDGEILPDRSLKGQIASGKNPATPFTAEPARAAEALNPNDQASSVTRVSNPQEAFRFHGIDGQKRTLDQSSAEFAGKPMIIDIFGTWCPNCHDEAPVLERLYRKYHDQGLVIVGLAYEYNDDTDRDLRQINIYREKYGVTFPLLLAGTTAEDQIAKTLPQLVGFGAFPTTIFVGRDGRVRGIHAGFQGPSTGAKYQQAQDALDQLTREIVTGSK